MISNKYKCIHVHIPKCAGTSITRTLFNRRDRHLTALQYKTLLGASYEDYFAFAFVRNPWDRMVSFHTMCLRSNGPAHKKLLQQCTNMFGTTLFSDWVRFVQWVNNDPNTTLGHSGLDSTLELSPQYLWLTDDSGNILVDFIGRFEQLLTDFNKVCRKLDMPDKQNTLRRLNTGDRGKYSSYYDSETRDIIGDVFKIDCEKFDYSFS